MAEHLSQQAKKSRVSPAITLALPSILLRAFIEGEAFFYQAPTKKIIDSSSFLVLVHKTSHILEHLRLFGKINVLARCSYGTFEGCLSFNGSAGEDNVALHLRLFDAIHHEISTEPRIMPMT